MVIGNDPSVSLVANLPTIGLVTNPVGVPAGDYLRFTYRRSTESVDAGVVANGQLRVLDASGSTVQQSDYGTSPLLALSGSFSF